MELMGYQPSKKKCGVSEHCIKLMTRKGLTGYGITHQLLWTMLSEQVSGNYCLKCLKCQCFFFNLFLNNLFYLIFVSKPLYENFFF